MTQPSTSLRSSWMGYLQHINSTLKLTELTIPGTHDTGTWKINSLNSAKCQDMDLKSQLEHGIRFIDIRLVPEQNNGNNDLMIYHGDYAISVPCYVWFSEVVEDICFNFLKKNPTETIIMSIKNEWGIKYVPDAQFTAALNPFINTSLQAVPGKSLFYTSNVVPDLATSAGQIVLVRRYTGDTIGIDAVTGWPDDEKTTTPTTGNAPLMVQDIYKMKFVTQGEKKWHDHIHPFLHDAMASPDQIRVLWFNFTSTSGGATPIVFATQINPLFQVWLETLTLPKTLRTYRFGIIPMDFPTPRLIDDLIMTNLADTSTVVQQGRGYTISLSNNKAHIGTAYKPGSWNYAQCYFDTSGNNAMRHALIKVSGKPTQEIHFGDTVRILSTEFTNDSYIYIQSDGADQDNGGKNLFYDNIEGSYQNDSSSVEWIVEWSPINTNPSVLGRLETGNIVRFRSAIRNNCYLLAAADQYLAVQHLTYKSDQAVKGGFDWVLE